MSVIAIAYTSHGFVIGADGRGSFSDGRHITNEEQKIFPAWNRDNIFSYSLIGLTALGDDSFVKNCRKWSKALQERQFSLHSEYVNAFTRHVREDIAISIATGGAFSGLPQEEETPNGWIVAKLIVAGYFNATPFIEACYITHRYSCINASWEDVDIIPLSGSPFLSPRCTALENKMHFSYADSLDSANEFIKTYLHQCCILAAEVKHDQIGGDIHIAEITPCAFRWRVPPKNL